MPFPRRNERLISQLSYSIAANSCTNYNPSCLVRPPNSSFLTNASHPSQKYFEKYRENIEEYEEGIREERRRNRLMFAMSSSESESELLPDQDQQNDNHQTPAHNSFSNHPFEGHHHPFHHIFANGRASTSSGFPGPFKMNSNKG
eukprot:sb/3473961/